MEQHPDLGDPVVLRDPEGREHPSTVRDLGNGLLVVAQPRDVPADEVIGTGADVTVTWADADGVVMVLPTRILAVHSDGPVARWSLAVTGPAYTQQRRRSERTAASGPVAIRTVGGEQSHVVNGSLVDVSEGGVRCAVAAGAADRILMGPQEVVAEFRLGTVDFAVPGRVEFLRPTANPARLEDLVVVFDEPVSDVGALRKEVFALQVRSLEEAAGEGDESAEGAGAT
ncbi:PilZ domain-containing protein [Nocardioides pocheonensis]|uniref:PilZ domain-containing protein n=1 Tax=Nocardioides pocheonensis TaxID=661485 RepID=A0A3N0GJU9_9ACTN|nr:PilZ domain-containing protein [Nocardioides pocheonensis]RNM12486.1 PilZ domain-containing protein [Nocardioides pocheonensis]